MDTMAFGPVGEDVFTLQRELHYRVNKFIVYYICPITSRFLDSHDPNPN